MKRKQPWLVATILLPVLLAPAAAQDIRGLEVCTVEKQLERRTSCLQANVEFLQQALNKLSRDADARTSAAERDLAAARAEIAALKATVEKLAAELAQLKPKPAAEGKK
jgi:hypothetical protein